MAAVVMAQRDGGAARGVRADGGEMPGEDARRRCTGGEVQGFRPAGSAAGYQAGAIRAARLT